jgi:ferritin
VTEQVEEEANATAIVEILKAIGDHSQGLIMLDRQLAARG